MSTVNLPGSVSGPPQTFELSGLLQEGDNELTLIVTGNMTNLHGKHPVWYGLEQDV